MRGEILSYFEMCQREGTSLQRGMNFRSRGRTPVFLMSLRPNAPYRDRVEEEERTKRALEALPEFFLRLS